MLNVMTETEAAKIKCHKLLEIGMSPTFTGKYHCRGSECMAWRWVSAGNSDHPPRANPPQHGYCGLAGKP